MIITLVGIGLDGDDVIRGEEKHMIGFSFN
jgi:hypothetical protein